MRILVVEDNPLLRHHLTLQLRDMGHQVDSAQDGKEADYYLQEHQPDIVVLDLGLPGELIQRWRAAKIAVPILLLTARDGWQEKVNVLQAGADDYVTKPFQLEEVVARLQVLLRRTCGLASQMISFPPYQVDLSRRELFVGDQPVKLTAFEYTILQTLLLSRSKIVSKETLMRQLYPDAELRESHTIDVLIGRLRKKMVAAGGQDFITTIRGQGYRFDSPVKE